MLTKSQKEALVAAMKNHLAVAQAVVIAENTGLSAEQMAVFRAGLKASGGRAQVVKNTLAKRAVAGSPFESLSGSLSGSLIYGMGDDPAVLSKAFFDAAKANEKLIIRGGALADGSILDAATVERLAAIPGRSQLLASLLCVMQAPVTTLVRLLNEVPGRFVRTLAAVRDAAAKE